MTDVTEVNRPIQDDFYSNYLTLRVSENSLKAYGDLLNVPLEWKEPEYKIDLTGATKPSLESEISKVHEQLADLNKYLNEERKERQKLLEENESLRKQLIKAKKRRKSDSTVLREQHDKIADLEKDVHDLKVEMDDLKDKWKFKEENR